MAGSQARASPAGGSATSPGHLLQLIRDSDGLTRQELLVQTGMGRSTLYERLEQLSGAGLIVEGGSPGPTGGRPARRLRFRQEGRVVLVLDIGQTGARASVASLGQRLELGDRIDVEVTAGPEAVLRPLVLQARALLGQRRPFAVGVSVPSPIEPDSLMFGHRSAMPGWSPSDLLDRVVPEFGAPLIAEMDARAMAVGELADGHDLICCKIASGTSVGIVVAGQLLRGVDGAAGDIGHIRYVRDGLPCRCGRLGCLATVASGRAILAQLGPGVTTLEEVVRRCVIGDATAVAAVRSAGDLIGNALAATVSTLNPRRLVLGGILGRLPLMAEAVHERLVADAMAPLTEHLSVEISERGESAVSIGMARLAEQREFSPERVDAMLAGRRA